MKNKKIQIVETIVFGYHRNNVASSKIIKRFSTKEHRHHNRTITKRDIGRLYGMTCNDLDELRIAKAEREGKTPHVWTEFVYWHMRRHRGLFTSRLKLYYGKLSRLLNPMPLLYKK